MQKCVRENRLAGSNSTLRGFVLAVLAALSLTRAQAAYHLWTFQEIYTDHSGTLQFIEMFSPETGQNSVNGLTIKVLTPNKLQTHTFSVPGSSLPGDTVGRTLLFGTAGLHAAGGPTPDYIIPDNFLFTGGGNLNFFNSAVLGVYSALPTDGVLSLNYNGGTSPNSPQNFAGDTGFIIVAPEPTASVLLALGTLCALGVRRARRP